MQILIFKTNLDSQRVMEVKSKLDTHPGIHKWNVDLNDCDSVLRIKSDSVSAKEVERLLIGSGVYCAELD